LLRRHLATLPEADAELLAEALGDLPLAVAQAAGLLAETGMSTSDYLEVLAEHAARPQRRAPRPSTRCRSPQQCTCRALDSARRTRRPGSSCACARSWPRNRFL
jgi:hypothetical protein